MAETETTNEQYKDFLNKALADGIISYNSTDGIVYNQENQELINLNGSRVVKDHDKDGNYEPEEMENPLNRSFIEYNAASQSFNIVDPAGVDWSRYFDKSIYPNVVDSLSDLPELNDDKSGTYFATEDTDKELPTLEEVRQWPVSFIRYHGARTFADYYGYSIPTIAQWQMAARGAPTLNTPPRTDYTPPY